MIMEIEMRAGEQELDKSSAVTMDAKLVVAMGAGGRANGMASDDCREKDERQTTTKRRRYQAAITRRGITR